ncbi:uncharacterized protein LACBIDRAFT_333560 [Laccaria bicolor S238N-H82]|uniref:Predicted protein n=1 Tax=Laccaria bicolor (strain S238N-H82 / ATCC MYA-4686) TaxID=486041 RepID=B0DWB0_LACBS|nr:uncharacterized protein LACBIDRAFT_333558 [Laccaria bicolor S238N-H82]XP_001888236.1 uncharacterized protein LACBIDRAFT_333560 [Laccaria bicolor S238N-H82]EDR01193.1 predicted protein [Laccaria bicolor S238N-H82]EDR01194.1 predicted protein [Laccaria bicolor S238N-H82]|eukprot:XP_001888235.1 predicted protein [Laccaria bicolor S238N-H82]
MSLGPITSQTQANVGPSVEIRRERGTAGEIPLSDGLLPLEVGGSGEDEHEKLLALRWGRGRYLLHVGYFLIVQPHEEWIQSAIPSLDGRLLLTCSDDPTARIKDLESPALKAEMRGHDNRIES